MTKAEGMLERAIKANKKGALDFYRANFIEDIRHFDKKQLSKLTSKQYALLRECADLYVEPRGGASRGQGRKLKWDEPTVTVSVRCPESRADELRAFIAQKLQEFALSTETPTVE